MGEGGLPPTLATPLPLLPPLRNASFAPCAACGEGLTTPPCELYFEISPPEFEPPPLPPLLLLFLWKSPPKSECFPFVLEWECEPSDANFFASSAAALAAR